MAMIMLKGVNGMAGMSKNQVLKIRERYQGRSSENLVDEHKVFKTFLELFSLGPRSATWGHLLIECLL